MFKMKSGTFASKHFKDNEQHVQYFVDVIQEPRLKGSRRMVHITQEICEPDQMILGVISFTWHKLELFVQKLHLESAQTGTRPDDRSQHFQQWQQQLQQCQRQPFLNGSHPNLLSPTQLLSTIIVPCGRLHKNQGTIACQISDRHISQRLGYTINHEDLSK
jgi:hypothetical protein